MKPNAQGKIEHIFKNRCSFKPLETVVCSKDSSVVKGSAVAVVYPQNKDEISRIVQLAGELDFQLMVRGGGSSLTGSAVPRDSVVICMNLMNDVQVGNGFVEVQPGVILSELNETLIKSEKFFPVVPASKSIATVGGMFSTNAVGLHGIYYGKMSDWIEEVDFIDGLGKKITISGKEAQELSGKEGIFGVVTRIKLKVVESEVACSLDTYKFENIDGLLDKVFSIRDAESIRAVEFVSPICCEYAEIEQKSYRLFVEYADENSGQIKGKEIKKAWKFRAGLGSVLNAAGLPLLEDPYVTERQQQKSLLEWFEEKKVPVFGHIGYGIFHPHFSRDQSDLIDEMFEFVGKMGGAVTGEHGYGSLKVKYMPELVRKEYLAVKKKYDPKNIFQSFV